MHDDHLGTSTVVTDEHGNVEQRVSFDAFGRRRNPDWRLAAVPGETLLTREGFTGHESDEALGLVNMRGRMYDPRTRRFLSADPFAAIGSSQGMNRYAYVVGNPLTHTDSSGFGCDPSLANPCNDSLAQWGTGDPIGWLIDRALGDQSAPLNNAPRAPQPAASSGNTRTQGYQPRQAAGAVAQQTRAQRIATAMTAMNGRCDEYYCSYDAMTEQAIRRGNEQFANLVTTGAAIGMVGLGGWELWVGRMALRGLAGFALEQYGPRVLGGVAARWVGAATADYVAAGTGVSAVSAGVATQRLQIGVSPEALAEAEPLLLETEAGAINALRFNSASPSSASASINAPRLAMQLVREEAESAFTPTGELSPLAIAEGRQIIAASDIRNAGVPAGFGKWATDTFNSPAGPFQVHYYYNQTTGRVFYGLDYKVIFNGERGPTYFVPASGTAP